MNSRDPLALSGENNPPSYLEGIRDRETARKLIEQYEGSKPTSHKDRLLRRWEKKLGLRGSSLQRRGLAPRAGGVALGTVLAVAGIYFSTTLECGAAEVPGYMESYYAWGRHALDVFYEVHKGLPPDWERDPINWYIKNNWIQDWLLKNPMPHNYRYSPIGTDTSVADHGNPYNKDK